MRSLADLYNTALSARDEQRFRQWAGERIRDTEDYDLRGAWKGNAQAAANGHLPDTYKKPNHPTFSAESEYSTPENPGGQWVDDGKGGFVFWAAPSNLKYQSLSDLARYFDQREQGNTVIAPIDWRLR